MRTSLVQPSTLGLVLLAAVGFSAHASDRANAERMPTPDEAACEAARSRLWALHRDAYEKAKTPIQKTALARRFMDRAAKTDNAPVDRFVMLRTARDIAVETADAHMALEAVEAMAEAFEIDAIGIKAESLAQIEEAARSPAQRKELAAVAVRLIDEAVALEAYPSARRLADVALEAARKAGDTDRVRQVVQRQAKLRQSEEKYQAIQQARAVLAKKPADPQANQAVGLYLCFKRGDWQSGLPMLARGGDEVLQALAQTELAGAATVQEQLALGDRWWELAEKSEGEDRDAPRLRAGFWYQKAGTGLAAGLARLKVEKRLAEIARIERPLASAEKGDAPSGRSAGVTAEKVVLWNTRNAIHQDRGTELCTVVLLRRSQVVWQMKGIPIAWSADANLQTVVKLPRLTFDVLRVEIVRWVQRGGGLAEIEVYRGNDNLAKGRPARASAPYDAENPIICPPGTVADGIRQEVEDLEGYWLLPGAQPGWIEIDLCDAPPEK